MIKMDSERIPRGLATGKINSGGKQDAKIKNTQRRGKEIQADQERQDKAG
jgi:hypothetical protein